MAFKKNKTLECIYVLAVLSTNVEPVHPILVKKEYLFLSQF